MSSTNVHAILASAGYQNFRYNRSDCPHCSGHRHLTVAIRGDLYYCHRCQRGGHVRSLARARGLSLPPVRTRKADLPKSQFRAWLKEKRAELSNTEHELARDARHAAVALQDCPDFALGWEILARWYDAKQEFETFWEAASDRAGQFGLYRAWRRQHAL